MGANTKIEWCDHTFNPWRGCTKIAPGCANCYAEAQAKRNTKTLGVWGPNGTRVVAAEAAWERVLLWGLAAAIEGESRSVFCGSMCDVFEDWRNVVTDAKGNPLFRADTDDPSAARRLQRLADVRDRVFSLIDMTAMTWLLLTKRPENIRRMIPIASNGRDAGDPQYMSRDNLWLGTSISCQDDAERNIPELLKCRDLCAGLFLSIEPLIGPVDVLEWLHDSDCHYRHGVCHCSDPRESHIDQVIIGGESGPNARPCNVDWIRSIARQCEAVGVPCFVKQLGSHCVVPNDRHPHESHWSGMMASAKFRDDGMARVVLRDKKGGDPAEWPEDLRRYRKLAWKGGA